MDLEMIILNKSNRERHEELRWVQLTLTLPLDLIDRRSSSFPPGYLELAVP